MSEAKLCVALDFNHASEAKNLISQLESLPVVMKIGLRLLPQFTQQDWAELVKKKVAFFIDAKLHDIPTQVEASVKTWAEWGASFLTLHLSGGPKMIESAVRAAENHPLKLLGVSVLTSLSENDLKTMGFNLNCEQVVKKWGQMAVENGFV
jgi:orotidine-5'-phosphate decarboxylase